MGEFTTRLAMPTTEYTERGFTGRHDYLQWLVNEFDASQQLVKSLTDVLPQEEDFGRLVEILEAGEVYLEDGVLVGPM